MAARVRSVAAAGLLLAAFGSGAGQARAADEGRWREESRVEGDLTGDGVPDLAIVRKLDDPANRVANEGLGPDTLDANPRELLVLRAKGGAFARLAATRTLLPPKGDADTPCLADPLEEGGVAIKNGLLVVRMQYWLSCGSYGVTNRTLRFRNERGRFRLIGYDRLEFSRASGMGQETSINYLTGRKKIVANVSVIGPVDGEKRPAPSESWSSIGREAFYLDEMDRTNCDDWDSAPSWC